MSKCLKKLLHKGLRLQSCCKWIHVTSANFHTSCKMNFAKALYDPENKGGRQDGINFDTIGSWNNRLDLPINLNQSIKRGYPVPQIKMNNIGCASVIGKRSENQDRYLVKELEKDLLCFAIFDGHGTALAVDFVREHIEEHLMYWLKYTKQLDVVLKKTFTELDNRFARYVHSKQCEHKEELHYSGTTATVCLLRNGVELVVGHVGDSRAILCREGKAIPLTKDHDPDVQFEQGRVVKFGGFVQRDSLGRMLVNGVLAMSRSLGDLEMKAYGVTAMPDTRSVGIKHSKDCFLVLITDGITYVMNDQEVCNTVSNCRDPSEAAHFITDEALQFGSEDNSTVVIIPFGAWGKWVSAEMPFSFGRIHNKNY